MMRGLFTLTAVAIGGLVVLAVGSMLLLPILGLATAVVAATIKLIFWLAVVYFVVRLVSPQTADRAVEKIRSSMRRVA